VRAFIVSPCGLASKVTGADHSRWPATGGSGQDEGGCEFQPPLGTGKEVRGSKTKLLCGHVCHCFEGFFGKVLRVDERDARLPSTTFPLNINAFNESGL
jgi:hypothetical protein